jgi:hypothetical protein
VKTKNMSISSNPRTNIIAKLKKKKGRETKKT